MENFFLLIAEIWLLSALCLLLHYYSPRFGFAPLVAILGSLTGLLQSQLGVYIEPVPGFIMFFGSNVLVPVILMAVLVIYISQGAVAARSIIYVILSVSLLMIFVQFMYRQHLSFPGGGALSLESAQSTLSGFSIRTTIASLLAFLADLFAIAVFYQGMKNYTHAVPEWIVIGVSLLAGLWTDAILFRMFSDLGTRYFTDLLPGDLIGKTVSAIILWGPVSFYLVKIASKMPGYVGGESRGTLDVFYGSLEEIKKALANTQAALQYSEQERRKEEAYFRQISENIDEALWLSKPNQNHAFFVNTAYENIWGRSAKDIYSNPNSFIDSIHPEDRERVTGLFTKDNPQNYEVKYRIIRPDGTIRWVHDRIFPIFNEDGVVYRIAGISSDITDSKLAEKAQLDLNLEREKVKLMREFVGEASHDLKSPLTSINLKIHQIAKAETPEKQAQYLNELGALSKRMSQMIDDLLTLARLDQIVEQAHTQFNVNEVLNEISDMLRPVIEDKKINVVWELAETPPILVADKEDIARALTNVIENALHYTPESGLVKLQTELKSAQVIIEVSDTGVGIPREDLPLIFNRFFRAGNAHAADPSGTGLGLAIVKKIIERYRGKIEVFSELGSGTSFVISLPMASET